MMLSIRIAQVMRYSCCSCITVVLVKSFTKTLKTEKISRKSKHQTLTSIQMNRLLASVEITVASRLSTA